MGRAVCGKAAWTRGTHQAGPPVGLAHRTRHTCICTYASTSCPCSHCPQGEQVAGKRGSPRIMGMPCHSTHETALYLIPLLPPFSHFPPGELVACKRGSPLILGIREAPGVRRSSFTRLRDASDTRWRQESIECFIASDASAVIEHTKK